MKAIPAVYEGGIFRPLTPIILDEQTAVAVVVPDKAVSEVASLAALAGVWSASTEMDAIMQTIEDERKTATYRD